jgi:hypothetical protein
MTTKAKSSTLATLYPAPVVLFGIDSRGKPKAARFGKDHASVAVKAASQLQLQVLANNNPKIAEIASRLPVGRVHVNGKTFVPFIRRDLYDKLVAVAANGNAPPNDPPASGSSDAPGSTSGGSPPDLPRNWREIAPGHLVIAQESLEDGWWEAIVLERNGDTLTLRWRDYPNQAKCVRHRAAVALISTEI